MTTNRLFTLILCAVFFCITSNAQLKFVESGKFPVFGKISDETETRYERLPANMRDVVREPVWNLGKHTAGLFLRFATNSSSIGVRWTLRSNFRMAHMTDVGVRGFDLYALENGEWVFVNSTRPQLNMIDNEVVVIRNMSSEMREFMLYFPLYNGVTALEIGIDSTAVITPPQKNTFAHRLPIIVYGTSITQGGCASRAGMVYTAILSRWLHTEVINLGFSGNGRLDLEIAEMIAQREASLIIIDNMPNTTSAQVEEYTEKFYRIIREKQPEVPILFVESPIFPSGRFDLSHGRRVDEKNEILRNIFNRLVEQGEQNIALVPAAGMIGNDGEATVDGVHFTDLGFMRFAEHLYPIIRRYLR
jgi:lysophospholipase L1-like esterase